MAEPRVELFLKREVVVVDKVGPVQVRIDAEHLAENGFAHFEKLLGEAGAFSEPIIAVAAGVGQGGRGDDRVVRKGGAVGVGGKVVGVIDFPCNPALHECHVFVGRHFDGLETTVEPSKRVVAVGCQS